MSFSPAPFCEADASETGSPSSMTCYWVSPPAESRPQELGRPMSMQYNLVHDGAVNNQDIVARVVRRFNAKPLAVYE